MDELWRRDSVQFPRLLAEINALGLTEQQEGELCGAMDLNHDELRELFDRAETAWEKIKARL